MAKVIQVIETQERRGTGQTENDPIRLVLQYWSLDGQLLWEEADANVAFDQFAHLRTREQSVGNLRRREIGRIANEAATAARQLELAEATAYLEAQGGNAALALARALKTGIHRSKLEMVDIKDGCMSQSTMCVNGRKAAVEEERRQIVQYLSNHGSFKFATAIENGSHWRDDPVVPVT